MVKILNFLSGGLVALFVLSSCNGRATGQDTEEEMEMRMDRNMLRTREDTLALDSLATTYLEFLKRGESDAALDMLSELSGDSVIPLSQESREEQAALYNCYPVCDYTVDSLFLYSETDTELRCTVVLFEKPVGDNRPNTMKFQLVPRRVDGIWKLLVKGRAIVR